MVFVFCEELGIIFELCVCMIVWSFFGVFEVFIDLCVLFIGLLFKVVGVFGILFDVFVYEVCE